MAANRKPSPVCSTKVKTKAIAVFRIARQKIGSPNARS